MGWSAHGIRRDLHGLAPWSGCAAALAAAGLALAGGPGWVVAVTALAGAGLLLLVVRRLTADIRAHEALVTGAAPEAVLAGTGSTVRLLAGVRRRHLEALEDLTNELVGITRAAGDLHGRGERLSAGAEAQTSSIDETLASILGVGRSVRAMVDAVEALFPAAETASTAVLSLVEGQRAAAAGSRDLLDLAGDLESAVGRQAEAANEARRGAVELAEASHAGGETVTLVAASIAEVARQAALAAQAAGAAARDAERGRDAASRARIAVDRMRDAALRSHAALDALGERGREIGAITTTIEQITDRTSLLALNAAIIAAQAGAHGEGFAVVADEIKRLAEETARRTVEIASLIRAVQDEVADAKQANAAGAAGVDDGVRLAAEAASAVDGILGSVRRARAAVEEIVRAAEQASERDALGRTVREEVRRAEAIAGAVDRHARQSQEVETLVRRMLELTRGLARANEEQQQAGASIRAVIQEMKGAVESMFAIARDQRLGSEQVLQATDIIRYISSENLEGIRGLSEAASVLRERLVRFGSAMGGVSRP